jgi:hypothetical protein
MRHAVPCVLSPRYGHLDLTGYVSLHWGATVPMQMYITTHEYRFVIPPSWWKKRRQQNEPCACTKTPQSYIVTNNVSTLVNQFPACPVPIYILMFWPGTQLWSPYHSLQRHKHTHTNPSVKHELKHCPWYDPIPLSPNLHPLQIALCLGHRQCSKRQFVSRKIGPSPFSLQILAIIVQIMAYVCR